ncbi:MAG: hypothetical protein KJS66_06395 [Acidobacteria bacterium]|nr:hypothetical protein [Acidobacteriota bacterium]
MKIRSIALAGVIAVAGIAVPTSIVDAATAGVTVKGVAPGASKVFLLTTSGRSYRATAEASGAFTISGVPAAAVGNSTLQFTDATSKYLGSAVFRVVKSGKFWKAIVGLKAVKSGTLNVGTLSNKGGWYKAAKITGAGTAGVRAVDKTGKPKGAGLAGRVKLVTAKVATMSTLQKLAATTCPDGSPKDSKLNGNEPGQDLDCDSVPNSIDVDDNGNGSLDILDQKTNDRSDKDNYTASIATYSGMRGTMASKLNTNAPGATIASLTTNITKLLSGTDSTGGNFQMAIFLGDWSLQGPSGELPDWVYIECPGIKWCDAATGTAKIYGNSEMNEIPGASAQIDGKSWNAFPSQDFSQAGFPKSTSAIYNGLYKFTQSKQNRWAAFLTPSYTAADVLNVVRANDVMVLHTIKGTNDVAIPVTVSPFFVTTPYLKSATANAVTVDNTDTNFNSGNIKIGDDGKVSVDFWRPQRMKLDGETGNTGDFSALTSQHGLNYGLQISGGSVNSKPISSFPETGCAGADVNKYYTSKTLTGLTQSYGPADQDPASDFWAMNDATSDDSPDNVLDMTLDLKGCVNEHKPAHFAKGGFADFAGKTVGQILGFTWDDFISNGNNYLDMTLTGTGSPSTNGYNRSVLQFRIYSSKWSGTASTNNNSGNNSGSSNNSGNNTGSNNSGNNNSGNNNSGNNTGNTNNTGNNTGGSSGSSGSATPEGTEIRMELFTGAAGRGIQFSGIGGDCLNKSFDATTGGSCTAKQSATQIVVIPQGTGSTTLKLSGAAEGVTAATSGTADNTCVGPSGSDGRYVCYIPYGQTMRKLIWIFQ